jgi:murein DD-endopeptidase MepM/ murein hydrolase activator NlpD
MRKLGFGALCLALLAAACSPVYLAHANGGTGPREEAPARVEPFRPAREPAAPASAASAELARVLGTLVWPLAADRSAILSSPYGVREHPIDGAERFHSGLDLRAPGGTPVYAAADGVVARSGAGGAYGNLVVIDHGAGLSSLYGHHRENLVREGERVRRGQVIALVGRTGNATGDHLHFELRWRGGTVDPRVVLPRLGGGAAR